MVWGVQLKRDINTSSRRKEDTVCRGNKENSIKQKDIYLISIHNVKELGYSDENVKP